MAGHSLYDGPPTPKMTTFPSKDAHLPLEKSVNANLKRAPMPPKVMMPSGPRSTPD